MLTRNLGKQPTRRRGLIKACYRILFPSVAEYIKQELQNCQSVLDLGCGADSPLQYCKIPFSVGVELFEPYLQASKKKDIHTMYIKGDITQVQFRDDAFDAVIALEVLEHIKKEHSLALIERLETWAKHKVIISMPNGYLSQDEYDNNPLQVHRSEWKAGDLRRLGYKVRGIEGLRILKGFRGLPRYHPKLFWKIVSDMTQKITFYFPDKAFQLLCVKSKHTVAKHYLSSSGL